MGNVFDTELRISKGFGYALFYRAEKRDLERKIGFLRRTFSTAIATVTTVIFQLNTVYLSNGCSFICGLMPFARKKLESVSYIL